MSVQKVTLSVETTDHQLVRDWPSKLHEMFEAPGGAAISFDEWRVAKSIDVCDVLTFTINLARDVDVNLFAAWLITKFSSQTVVRVTIDREDLTVISETEIRRSLKERIRIER